MKYLSYVDAIRGASYGHRRRAHRICSWILMHHLKAPLKN